MVSGYLPSPRNIQLLRNLFGEGYVLVGAKGTRPGGWTQIESQTQGLGNGRHWHDAGEARVQAGPSTGPTGRVVAVLEAEVAWLFSGGGNLRQGASLMRVPELRYFIR